MAEETTVFALGKVATEHFHDNHGWCEGLPLISLPSSIRRLAFTLLYRPVSNEKRTRASWEWRSPLPFRTLAGI